uniref:RxLR effector candidate protein n=1 Tax=Hyaloperonospora arabidopsidis (strain Emoy2) TaxID=559515 RepID=A0A090C2P1_HYAAE|nr:RxLR effector candidate protein [Hyaloperonospora arabidopsidis Emoy2]
MIAPGKLILTAAFALFLLDDADFATATLLLRSTFDDRTREDARSLRASERAVGKNLKLEEERMNTSTMSSVLVNLATSHPFTAHERLVEMEVLAKLSGKLTKSDNTKWLNKHVKSSKKKRDARYTQWVDDTTPEGLEAALHAFDLKHNAAQQTLQEFREHFAVDQWKKLGWDGTHKWFEDLNSELIGLKRYDWKILNNMYPKELELMLGRLRGFIDDTVANSVYTSHKSNNTND